MSELDLTTLQGALTTQVFGRNLVILPRTGSTNDVAKDLAAKGAPEGTVVVAEEQSAGRGRRGRRWVAQPGTCLLLSILFRPDVSVAGVHQLAMLCSLAAADAVEGLAGLHVALKWPNDLIVESRLQGPSAGKWRKLAGILTETGVVRERVEFAVVGMGINVNVPAANLSALAPDATSVLAEIGRKVDRALLVAALLEGVEVRHARLQEGIGPYEEWTSRLVTLGQPVEAITSAGTLAGVAEGVDEEGALLLRTPDGVLHQLLAADVTLSG